MSDIITLLYSGRHPGPMEDTVQQDFLSYHVTNGFRIQGEWCRLPGRAENHTGLHL